MTAYPFANLRRDNHEEAIVYYLRMHGLMVWRIHGTGVPDLLVWSSRACMFVLLEVKSARGKLTEAQRRAFAVFDNEKAPAHVVRTPEEALAMVRQYDNPDGGPRCGGQARVR